MAGERMHSAHFSFSPLDAPLAISYRNHQKSLAYFSHLAPLVFFTKRQSQNSKWEGGRHNGPLSKYVLNIALVTWLVKVALQEWMLKSGVIGGKNVPYWTCSTNNLLLLITIKPSLQPSLAKISFIHSLSSLLCTFFILVNFSFSIFVDFV